MSDTTILPTRSEVPTEQTWDLESVFASPADWETACQSIEEFIPKLSAFQGRFQDGPAIILEYFDLVQEAGTLMGKIFTYASNKYAVDTNDQSAAARAGQARSLGARFGAATAFTDPELMAIGFKRLHQWLQNTPEFSILSHYIDRLERRQKHVRSGEVEQILALTGDPFSGPFSIYSSLNNADLTFKPAIDSNDNELEVGQSSIGGLITNNDREVRRTAWENYADSYLAFKNTFAATLTSAIKQDVFRMRARGYVAG